MSQNDTAFATHKCMPPVDSKPYSQDTLRASRTQKPREGMQKTHVSADPEANKGPDLATHAHKYTLAFCGPGDKCLVFNLTAVSQHFIRLP